MKHFVSWMSLLLLLMTYSPALAQQTIVCRDSKGVWTGSIQIQERGRIIFRDRRGVKTVSARMMQGKTIFYDRSGTRVGEMTGGSFPLFGCEGGNP